MKKILAVILVVASMFLLMACGPDEPVVDNAANISRILEMYKVSAPTKVVTSYTTKIGNVEFGGYTSLVSGMTANGKKATVQLYEYETLQSIETGAGDLILPIMGEPEKGSREYYEGKGERINGGRWLEDGYDFAPVAGSIAIKIAEVNIKDISFTDEKGIQTLAFTVPAENVAKVFGADYGITSEAKVVITANGAVITGITITYSSDILSEDEEIIYPSAEVTISTTYTYDVEKVTLVKNP